MADSGSAQPWELGAPDVRGSTPDRPLTRLWRATHRRLVAASQTVFTWVERSRQRRYLAALSNDSLKDLDISRADAEAEYRKYFWQE